MRDRKKKKEDEEAVVVVVEGSRADDVIMWVPALDGNEEVCQWMSEKNAPGRSRHTWSGYQFWPHIFEDAFSQINIFNPFLSLPPVSVFKANLGLHVT